MESGSHPLWPLLVSYRNSYEQRLELIKVNLTDFSKKDSLLEWIREGYYYADLTYQTGLQMVGTGGKLNRINQEGAITKTDLTSTDLFEIYTQRTTRLRPLEDRVTVLLGHAIPIVPGTLRFVLRNNTNRYLRA